MFTKLLSSLQHRLEDDAEMQSRRLYERRNCDRCVTVIGDKIYPVENWSIGGLLVHGDSRPFGIDNEINVQMKFKLHNDVLDVSHRARVIRKSHDKIAFEFLPLTTQILRNFKNVVDDHVTGQFADSQLA